MNLKKGKHDFQSVTQVKMQCSKSYALHVKKYPHLAQARTVVTCLTQIWGLVNLTKIFTSTILESTPEMGSFSLTDG
jgi:hypothetical protein